MTKDYYKILDVPDFSSQLEIKNAYRKLARKYHPDVAGNSKDVVARFKEINEAYSVLSNKEQKISYDRAKKFYDYGMKDKNSSQSYSKTTTNPNFKNTYNYKNDYQKKSFWQDFFKSYDSKYEAKYPKKGNNVYYDVEISHSESINGTNKLVNILQTQVCSKCNGEKNINGATCHFCNGSGETSSFKKFNVKIPAGIKDKSKIRLAGEGEIGKNGGDNGDLYLIIHVKNSESYEVDGLNILKNIAITPSEAVLGTSLRTSTPIGNVNFSVEPRTKNGQKIRLAGCGIEQNNKIGDMILTVVFRIPQNLTNEEISLYKKLQDISSKNGNLRDRLDY